MYFRNLDERISVNTLKRLIVENLGSYGQIVYAENLNQNGLENTGKLGENKTSTEIVENHSTIDAANTYKILSINARKTLAMKGQAFVSFETPGECQNIYKKLQSGQQEFKILDKAVEVQLARSDSDCVIKRQLKNDEEYEKYFLNRINVKKQKQQERIQQLQKKRKMEEADNDSSTILKKQKGDGKGSAASSEANQAATAPPAPNKVLLVQNLPGTISMSELEEIFSKYPGFLEVRLVLVKKLCFVEYENVLQAIKVKESTKDPMVLKGSQITIDFAK